MASDLKFDQVMTASQRGPNVHLMGNPAVCIYMYQEAQRRIDSNVRNNSIIKRLIIGKIGLKMVFE